MVQYEIKVTGRVQGVGFRYFVQKQATLLDLCGWVKNQHDGSVLIVVQGEESAVNTLVDHLRIGPSLSRVAGVSKTKMEIATVFYDFQVRY